jgi:MHS family proline/betaine transporter-like MFS transporter
MPDTSAPDTTALPAGSDAMRSMRRRAIASCLVGNFMELYDFTLYGFFAIFLGQAFFPSANPLVSLLSSLATFGVGFIMRPVGGLVMGAYADRFGRKGALILTMAMMAIATGMPGVLPGYATIGIWAPALLVLCRLAQGFSTGGEWGGAVIFMAEYATPGHRGFYASFMQVGVALGSLCGAGSAWLLTATLDQASLHAWGWRIPFVVGFLLLPLGYYLRTRVNETPAFERLVAARKVAHMPLREAFAHQKLAMCLVCGTSFIWNAGGYVMLVYLPSFASQVLKVDLQLALAATTIGTVVRAVLTPVVGAISDRVGRKTVIQAMNVAFFVLSYPLFLWMKTVPGFQSVLVASLVAGVLMAMVAGAGPVMLTELFPTRLRSTPIGIGYNVSAAIFGGFAPFICTWLVGVTGTPIAPTYFLLFCAAASFLTVTQLRDRTNVETDAL